LDFARASRAANTRRAYAADVRCFGAWCAAAGFADSPAPPEAVARYLEAKAGELGVSTLARRLAAIRTAHLDQDQVPPDSAEIRQVWRGIKRQLGRPPTKKKALLAADVARLVELLPATLTGVRDRALLLICYAGALRRSEVAALAIDGPDAGPVRLVFVAEGMEIHLDRSKGDQEGRGAVIGIPYTGTSSCPVAALEAWLKASRIRSGPLFRKIDRWGRFGSSSLTPAACSQIVKAACSAAGLNARVFTVHSLRRGIATDAARKGLPLDDVRRHLRHSDVKTTIGYVEAGDRFQASLAGKVGL
jgi:integrase